MPKMVYVCSGYDASLDYEEILGIFSTKELAQEQGRVWAEDNTDNQAECFYADGKNFSYRRLREDKDYDCYYVRIDSHVLDIVSHF